ncbi:MAG: hypothetical protein ACR2LA_08220, partial [Acidimicrobiales bacterium]
LLGIASIWIDRGTNLTTGLGLISAGLAFALQQVVTAVAGYFVLEAARHHATPAAAMSQDALEAMRSRYAVSVADIDPHVYFRITDNWLELSLRFVVPDRGIRAIKDAMSRQILDGLDAAGIGIASATYDIVGLPEVRLVSEP